MESKVKGQAHGSAVRKAGSFAAAFVAAIGKDIALNARRGVGYLAGFAQGLLRPNA